MGSPTAVGDETATPSRREKTITGTASFYTDTDTHTGVMGANQSSDAEAGPFAGAEGPGARGSGPATPTTAAAAAAASASYRAGVAASSRGSAGLRERERERERALGGVSGRRSPASSRGSGDSEGSSPDEGDAPASAAASAAGGILGLAGIPRSLPVRFAPHLFGGLKCPICSKFVPSDEVEVHLVMCLTKPRVSYNEDVLTKDAGECAICLDEMDQGDTIARLPCLCIYHKGCIDSWFKVNRSCPEHPPD